MVARLIEVAAPAKAQAAVLVLHGGAARFAGQPVRPSQLSVLRMIPTARRIRRAGPGRLAVFRLLNANRGWNPGQPDLRWALDRIEQRFGPLPVGLVGHSLGGRAALMGRTDPRVRSVVALAPWVEVTDAIRSVQHDHSDTPVLVVHGDADRIASIDRAKQVTAALADTEPTSFVTVEGGSHAMLRHHRVFDGLAADFTAATLLGSRPPAGPLTDVLNGTSWITV